MDNPPPRARMNLLGYTVDRSLALLVLGAVILIIIGLVSIPLVARRAPALGPETTPEGVVQHFYAAAYNGDYQAAYGYVGAEGRRTLSMIELQQQLSSELQQSQVRVGTASVNGTSASVPVTFTHFGSGGLFGSQEWSSEREVLLQREGDSWKIAGGAFY